LEAKMRLLLLPPVLLSWALVTTVLVDDDAFCPTTLKVHDKLVPNTLLLFPPRGEEDALAAKPETALRAAATVVAMAGGGAVN
jgi:hypothetical protein